MKKVWISISFKDDKVMMLGENKKILMTHSRQSAIPMNLVKKVLTDIETSKNCKIKLNVGNIRDT